MSLAGIVCPLASPNKLGSPTNITDRVRLEDIVCHEALDRLFMHDERHAGKGKSARPRSH